jgi:uncharacterized protein (DUF2164 family)
MTIEIDKEARKQVILSIERYFREHMEEPIGNITAGALLGFFLEEVGTTRLSPTCRSACRRG